MSNEMGGEFRGKRVLVTGGTKGIGRATAERFTAGEATVITTARTAEGDPDHFIRADVSTREGCDRVIAAVLERFGGVDVLINSVGGSSAPAGGALALTDDEWGKAIDLNLLSAVRLDRGLLPAMLARGGGVVGVLPGPPGELQRLWPRAVASEPLRRVLAQTTEPDRRVLRLYGASESAVAKALADAGGDGDGVDRRDRPPPLPRRVPRGDAVERAARRPDRPGTLSTGSMR